MGKISNIVLKLLPEGNLKNRFRDIEGIEDLPISETGIANGMPFVRLNDGLIFHGVYPTMMQKIVHHIFMSRNFRQKIPETAYAVIWDIWLRYWAGGHINQQRHYQIKEGDVVVEAGAYIGYYTLKISQAVGPKGKVIAIEPVEENRKIILENIKANNIHNVTLLPYAVWNEKGFTTFHLTNRQKNSLTPKPLQGKGNIRQEIVPTNTIDEIVAEIGVDIPNLVIITVNGVEVEALQGMERILDEGTNLVIAAKYIINGTPTYQLVTTLLEKKGYNFILDHYGFTKNESPENHAVIYASQKLSDPK